MKVGGSYSNYDGALITESVSPLANGNSCPQSYPWPNPPCAGSSTFSVGTGGTAVASGITLQSFSPVTNQFYDEHTLTSFYNLLGYSGLSSCTNLCTQTYSCGGNPIASFTITEDLAPGTVGSSPVTNVSATKY